MGIYDESYGIEEKPDKDPQDAFTTVYPIMVRTHLVASEVVYREDLVYIAGSEEKAREWCKRNTDIAPKDEEKHWWWFAILLEAVDGEYSGIRGLACLLDWDANELHYQPVNGYIRTMIPESDGSGI